MNARATLPSVTIAVMPREKYCAAEESLRSVLDHTDVPFDLVYVDAGTPPAVVRSLRSMLAGRDHEYVRVDRYLPPFEANMLGARGVDTEFIVFVDNDVFVEPGWLRALLECAVHESADVVAPLIAIGTVADKLVHVAGGDSSFEPQPGAHRLQRSQRHEHETLDAIEGQLRRTPTTLVESHCVMIRTSLVHRLADSGALDPATGHFTNTDELSDALRRAGAAMWFEPAARVVYLFHPSQAFRWADIRSMNHMWSERWMRADLDRMALAHGIESSARPSRDVRWWYADHRRMWLKRWWLPAERTLRRLRLGLVVAIARRVFERVERLVNRLAVRSTPTHDRSSASAGT